MIEESKKKSRKRAKVPGTYERAYRARCYPTPKQARKLARLFGARRYVYNWALELKQSAYAKDKTSYSFTQLCKELTALRQHPEMTWLQNLPMVPLQQVLRDLNTAFTRFFKGQARYPQFKRKAYAGLGSSASLPRRVRVRSLAGAVELGHHLIAASSIGMALCRELAVARFDVFGRHDVRRRTVAERVPPLPRIRQGLEALKRALHHVARSPPGDAAQGFDGLADRPGCCPRPVTIRRR